MVPLLNLADVPFLHFVHAIIGRSRHTAREPQTWHSITALRHPNAAACEPHRHVACDTLLLPRTGVQFCICRVHERMRCHGYMAVVIIPQYALTIENRCRLKENTQNSLAVNRAAKALADLY